VHQHVQLQRAYNMLLVHNIIGLHYLLTLFNALQMHNMCISNVHLNMYNANVHPECWLNYTFLEYIQYSHFSNYFKWRIGLFPVYIYTLHFKSTLKNIIACAFQMSII
jgi:hypothetical protein